MRIRVSAAIAVLAGLVCVWPPACFAAQAVQGRFYPEKQTYLVGEPVFVVVEVANAGEQAVTIVSGSTFGGCAQVEGFGVEVSGSDPVRHWPPGCGGGVAGSCSSGLVELHPGATNKRRLLLNEWYRLEQPGEHEVWLRGQVRFGAAGEPILREAHAFESRFSIVLAASEQAELQAAYQPLVKDLNSENFNRRVEALVAITELAPPFLEETILELTRSADSFAVGRAIEGLKRLNTPGARAALAELAEGAREEGLQQQAILALGVVGDRSYFPLVQRLAQRPEPALRYTAIRTAGQLGREEAVPFLVPLLRSADPLIRLDVVSGLANTVRKEAIPVLIEVLQDPDERVRQAAANALSQLTHRTAQVDVREPSAAKQAGLRWTRWWLLEGNKVEVYGPEQCASPQPLD